MEILSLIENQQDYNWGWGAYVVVTVIVIVIFTCYGLYIKHGRRKNPFYHLKMRIFPDSDEQNDLPLVAERPGRSEESLLKEIPIVKNYDEGRELPLVAQGQGRDWQY